jgi:sRNA-binding carbon storage regulator CsrA
MLVLLRRLGETIHIGEDITVEVGPSTAAVSGLGFEHPRMSWWIVPRSMP